MEFPKALVGNLIREARKDSSLTVEELANKIGVSQSMVSQIERGQASPSLETLWKISTILEVPIFRFLRESFDEKIKVLRSEENEEIKILHPNVRYKMLIPNPLKKIDVMELLVEPNSEFIPPELSHNGDEFGYVISGTLTLFIHGQEYILNEGDSINFDSTLPHCFYNKSNQWIKCLWIMFPKA